MIGMIGKRRAYMDISVELVVDLIRQCSNLPEDARECGVYWDEKTGCFRFILESKKFDMVSEGCEYPRFYLLERSGKKYDKVG